MSPEEQSETPDQSRWVYIISGLLIAGLFAAYFILPSFQSFVDKTYRILSSGDQQRVTSYMQSFGFWGAAMIVVLMVVQMFLIVVPSWLLMIVAVLAYGPWWGGLLSVVAVTVASTIGYFIGINLSDITVYRIIGQKAEQKMERYLEQYGVGAVVIFRLAPFLSNDAISFVAGMLRMGYWRFIGATLAGIIPLSALIAYFGKDAGQLETGLMWIGGISLALYIAYIVYRQWRKA